MSPLLIAGMLLALPIAGTEVPAAPGEGLLLSPTPVLRSEVRLPQHSSPSSPVPLGAAAGLAIAVAGGAAVLRNSRREEEPIFVIVHGHGGSPEDFDVLLEMLGVEPSRVVAFDYSAVGGSVSSTESSRTASTERAAEALDTLIRELALKHESIYSIHHSRGGAVGVTMIGALDDGTRPPIDGYIGAALLDPAIAGGWLGRLQSIGGIGSRIPDDGGFSVERCTNGECRDVRENLGVASNVEVIAIRNLDAEITNFRDNPPGLRVFDLVHDGGIAARWLLPLSPILSVGRVWQAHASVLEHEAVADCIAEEVAEPGSCTWEDGRPETPVWRSGFGGSGHTMLE